MREGKLNFNLTSMYFVLFLVCIRNILSANPFNLYANTTSGCIFFPHANA